MKQSDRYIPAVGITGGVGSGKSVVMEILKEEFGAEVILADLVAHDLMEPGAASYEQIVEEFGSGIVGADGQIDRPALSSLARSASGSSAFC